MCERRGDPRRKGYVGGRSINLAVSARGIAGLASVGLDREILAGHAIPMPGRMIHGKDGSTVFQPYSKNPRDAINSFSRGGLNLALIEAAAREKGVELIFDCPCIDVDFTAPAGVFGSPNGATRRIPADLVIGADGAYSAVRLVMQKMDRFEYSQAYLGHGYKELRIPAIAENRTAAQPQSRRAGDGFAMAANALHIWPRGGAMMIALPNTDGSFTNTLFWPWEGEHSFAALEGEFQKRRERDPLAKPTDQERQRVWEFFTAQYGDAVGMMPTLVDDYFANPTGSLVTVKCSPWERGGKVVLLGDAAHAIVPFYGQGMNAAFEDVVCLSRLLRERGDQAEALRLYQDERKPNADAIADMALENFIEMRDSVGSPAFRYRKKLEQAVHDMFEDRVSPQYNLVSFSTVPYVEARQRGAELARIVDRLAGLIPAESGIDDAAWRARVRHEAGLLLAGASGSACGRIPRADEAAGLIDITPKISDRLKVWPGDTPPSRQVLCDIDAGANITLSTLHATVHLGAHADGPNHYGKHAPGIDRMPLSHYFGECQVLEARAKRGARIGIADVHEIDKVRCSIVLIRTGTFPDSEKWTEDFAGLSVELVDELARRGVRTVGIDTPSVDLYSSKDLEAHQAFLRNGMAIIEGLVLAHVVTGAERRYRLIALPLPLEGFDASPVRAVLQMVD